MNLTKWIRKISFPLVLMYWVFTSFRNYLYDKNVLKTRSFPFPILVVGNLSTGGTGKTPYIDYLVEHLKQSYSTVVLSRGYGRKTRGFLLASEKSSPFEIGDEPKLLKIKHRDIQVGVCESRVEGIEKLRNMTNARVFVLDDAFQHRSLKPGFSVLLTSYEQLYTRDHLLPYGNLRESKQGARRANAIIVTKCPPLSEEDQLAIRKELGPNEKQRVYFSKIIYADYLYSENQKIPFSTLKDEPFLLLTGIANPLPLVNYLDSHNLKFEMNVFGDHHIFSDKELLNIQKKANGRKIITTEKDFVRIGSERLSDLFSLPITVSFLNREEEFIKQIHSFIESVK